MLARLIKGRLRYDIPRIYNALLDLWRRPADAASGDLAEFNEVAERARERSDISDHLVTMFAEALSVRPRLIVELGVRGGESTFVFERVARLCGASLVSCDVDDCSVVSAYPGWHFVQSDDIEFAARFPEWCHARGIVPSIDLLFIDTSHRFDQTVAEIDAWFPLLAERSKAIFHDSNLRPLYVRKDGSIGFGMDCDRGVIRALERFLGRPYNERRDFMDARRGWLIRHSAHCCGLAILERLPDSSAR